MDLSSLLSGLAWPLVSRVLTAMGIGVVMYAGAATALSAAATAAKSAWSGMAPDVLQLLTMAGVFESMAISVGGITGGLAMIAFKRLGLVTQGT